MTRRRRRIAEQREARWTAAGPPPGRRVHRVLYVDGVRVVVRTYRDPRGYPDHIVTEPAPTIHPSWSPEPDAYPGWNWAADSWHTQYMYARAALIQSRPFGEWARRQPGYRSTCPDTLAAAWTWARTSPRFRRVMLEHWA